MLLVGLALLAALAVVRGRGRRSVWIDEATLDPAYGPRLLPTVDLSAVPTPALIVTPLAPSSPSQMIVPTGCVP